LAVEVQRANEEAGVAQLPAEGGGRPLRLLLEEVRAMGLMPPTPPRMDASRLEAMRHLWTGAGLEAVATREITVHRTFADFDEYWEINRTSPVLGSTIAAMAAGDLETLRKRVRAHLPEDTEGRITYGARAHAIKGRVVK
jgi:hypothetical protein